MSSVGSTTDINSYLAPTSGVTKINSGDVMSQDDFLTLLATELQNQDPTDPLDNKDLVLQLSQFSTLSTMETLNKNMENFISTSTINTLTGLIGKSVTYDTTDADGNKTSSSGTVGGVNISSDGTVTLDVGGASVGTANITSISNPVTTTENASTSN